MGTDARSYFQYWGKTKENSFHLLAFHSLDVAAAGQMLLENNQLLLGKFSELTGLSQERFLQWFVFMSALHDIGKFADSFQNLNPEILCRLQKRPSSLTYSSSFKHDSLGFSLWKKSLKPQLQSYGLIPKSASRRPLPDSTDFWISSVTGHHGCPPKSVSNRRPSDDFNQKDRKAASEFIDDLIPILLPNGSPFPYDKAGVKQKQASFQIAGLAVLSDWIGSNTQFFKYETEPMPLHLYWKEKALKRAAQAVDEVHLLNCRPSSSLEWKDLLKGKNIKPNPMQSTVFDIKISQAAKTLAPTAPHLFILEDATGSGKTEAALFLSWRLMKSGLGKGLYFALPTMATSNVMYKRLKAAHEKLFGQDASLILAHSARDLVKDFKTAVFPENAETEGAYGKGEAPAGFYCKAWLADRRKKALLSDVGVGTVDQALLAVLPAKHQSLRMLGLLGKILVIDEVHAYDSYTNKLLRILLEAHASFGGSAILLSATLPKKQKQELIESWNKACGNLDHAAQRQNGKEEAYPLISCVSEEGLWKIPMPARQNIQKNKAVQFLSQKFLVMDALEKAVRSGSCACWIRNTVKDAVQSYIEIKNRRPDWEVLLFHSRFTLVDRLDIEDQIVDWFGKQSSSKDRSGRILIATQVVEQSLDLDFDVMISDLAPIDLLIQRAGRLQRHARDIDGNLLEGKKDKRGPAALNIYSPEWTESPDKSWYNGFFPSGGKVYPHHGRLWLTVKALKEHGGIRIPENARALIEGVYGEQAQKLIPEGLSALSNEAEGSSLSALSFAAENALVLQKGYTDEQRWGAAVSTRLSEGTVTIYLAKWENGDLRPWRDDSDYPWQYSSVVMRAFWVKEAAADPQIPRELLEECRKSLPAEGRYGVLMPLVKGKNRNDWIGEALNEKGGSVQFVYNRNTGLIKSSSNSQISLWK